MGSEMCIRDRDKIGNIKLSANWMAAVGHPNEDANLYKTVAAVGLELCPALGVCIPVGKDSTSMQTRWQEDSSEKTVTSPLSLIVSAFSPVSDIRDTLTPQLERRGDSILLLVDLASGNQRLGGSLLMQCQNRLGGVVADVDDADMLRRFVNLLQQESQRNRILAYHDRSDGGLFATLAEMMFASRVGLSVTVPDDVQPVDFMFNEELGVVIQIAADDLADVEAVFSAEDIPVQVVATESRAGMSVSQSGKELMSVDRATLQRRWSETSYNIQSLRDLSLIHI